MYTGQRSYPTGQNYAGANPYSYNPYPPQQAPTGAYPRSHGGVGAPAGGAGELHPMQQQYLWQQQHQQAALWRAARNGFGQTCGGGGGGMPMMNGYNFFMPGMNGGYEYNQPDPNEHTRPGWAESRPGRTPCKEAWWLHVQEQMTWVDSPRGIDLDAEEEHANVAEELAKMGSSAGVVENDYDAQAQQYQEQQNYDPGQYDNNGYGNGAGGGYAQEGGGYAQEGGGYVQEGSGYVQEGAAYDETSPAVQHNDEGPSFDQAGISVFGPRPDLPPPQYEEAPAGGDNGEAETADEEAMMPMAKTPAVPASRPVKVKQPVPQSTPRPSRTSTTNAPQQAKPFQPPHPPPAGKVSPATRRQGKSSAEPRSPMDGSSSMVGASAAGGSVLSPHGEYPPGMESSMMPSAYRGGSRRTTQSTGGRGASEDYSYSAVGASRLMDTNEEGSRTFGPGASVMRMEDSGAHGNQYTAFQRSSMMTGPVNSHSSSNATSEEDDEDSGGSPSDTSGGSDSGSESGSGSYSGSESGDDVGYSQIQSGVLGRSQGNRRNQMEESVVPGVTQTEEASTRLNNESVVSFGSEHGLHGSHGRSPGPGQHANSPPNVSSHVPANGASNRPRRSHPEYSCLDPDRSRVGPQLDEDEGSCGPESSTRLNGAGGGGGAPGVSYSIFNRIADPPSPPAKAKQEAQQEHVPQPPPAPPSGTQTHGRSRKRHSMKAAANAAAAQAAAASQAARRRIARSYGDAKQQLQEQVSNGNKANDSKSSASQEDDEKEGTLPAVNNRNRAPGQPPSQVPATTSTQSQQHQLTLKEAAAAAQDSVSQAVQNAATTTKKVVLPAVKDFAKQVQQRAQQSAAELEERRLSGNSSHRNQQQQQQQQQQSQREPSPKPPSLPGTGAKTTAGPGSGSVNTTTNGNVPAAVTRRAGPPPAAAGKPGSTPNSSVPPATSTASGTSTAQAPPSGGVGVKSAPQPAAAAGPKPVNTPGSASGQPVRVPQTPTQPMQPMQQNGAPRRLTGGVPAGSKGTTPSGLPTPPSNPKVTTSGAGGRPQQWTSGRQYSSAPGANAAPGATAPASSSQPSGKQTTPSQPPATSATPPPTTSVVGGTSSGTRNSPARPGSIGNSAVNSTVNSAKGGTAAAAAGKGGRCSASPSPSTQPSSTPPLDDLGWMAGDYDLYQDSTDVVPPSANSGGGVAAPMTAVNKANEQAVTSLEEMDYMFY